MMKSRKLGIGLLLMLAVVVTTGTFAYWSAGLTADSEGTSATVSIGTASTTASIVTLTAVTTDGSALIPTSRGIAGTDDTVDFAIPVAWAEDTTSDFAGVTGTLTMSVTYSMSNSTLTSGQLDDMYSYTFDVTSITEGAAAVDVTLTVVFDTEPTNSTIYADVAGETLTVTVTITVTP